MGVVITDETVRITKLNVFTPGQSRPIPFYIYGPIRDEEILDMEQYITGELAKDKFLGLNECMLRYMNTHNLQVCYLN